MVPKGKINFQNVAQYVIQYDAQNVIPAPKGQTPMPAIPFSRLVALHNAAQDAKDEFEFTCDMIKREYNSCFTADFEIDPAKATKAMQTIFDRLSKRTLSKDALKTLAQEELLLKQGETRAKKRAQKKLVIEWEKSPEGIANSKEWERRLATDKEFAERKAARIAQDEETILEAGRIPQVVQAHDITSVYDDGKVHDLFLTTNEKEPSNEN